MPYYTSVGPKFSFRATTGKKLFFSHDKPVGVSDEKEIADCDTYIPDKLSRAELPTEETPKEAAGVSEPEAPPEPEAELPTEETPKKGRGRK